MDLLDIEASNIIFVGVYEDDTMPDGITRWSTRTFVPCTIDGVGTCWQACRGGRYPLRREV